MRRQQEKNGTVQVAFLIVGLTFFAALSSAQNQDERQSKCEADAFLDQLGVREILDYQIIIEKSFADETICGLAIKKKACEQLGETVIGKYAAFFNISTHGQFILKREYGLLEDGRDILRNYTDDGVQYRVTSGGLFQGPAFSELSPSAVRLKESPLKKEWFERSKRRCELSKATEAGSKKILDEIIAQNSTGIVYDFYGCDASLSAKRSSCKMTVTLNGDALNFAGEGNCESALRRGAEHRCALSGVDLSACVYEFSGCD